MNKYILSLVLFVLASCGGSQEIDYCELDKEAMLVQLEHIRGKPISWSSQLEVSAKRHSIDIATTGLPTHRGTDNTLPVDRAIQSGWKTSYIGENLTAGLVDQNGAMNSWINSPSHFVNLSNQNFTHVGAHCTKTNNNYKVYWVQVFGA